MSFLAKIFGSGKNGQVVATSAEAIQKLRIVEEMLIKKQEYLEKKSEQEMVTVRSHGKKNKRVALQALKRKKRYEKQLDQIDGTLTTIEFQREALENAKTNTEVLKIMGYAAKALKNAHDDMDIDKIHDLMDDVQEQQEIANEISEAFSNPVGFGNEVGEDELLKELEELEQEDLDAQLLDVEGPSTDKLPSPTSAEPARPSKANAAVEQDEDVKKLAAWTS